MTSMVSRDDFDKAEYAQKPLLAQVTYHRYDLFRKVILTDDILKSLYESLSPRYNQGAAFKGDDGGSSGSFFFFSHDKKYIVKTMSSSELKLFTCEFLDKFTNHL